MRTDKPETPAPAPQLHVAKPSWASPKGAIGITTANPPFDGVLLDLFGTLVPAGPRVDRAEHLYRMAEILHVDPEAFERDWSGSFRERVSGGLGSLGETIRRIAERQDVSPSAGEIQQTIETRLTFTRSQLDACGPVLPALDALGDAGVRLAVVSDASEEAPLLWSSCALGSRIAVTVFSCREGFCKPDPRMYFRALAQLDLPAEQCAYVGDGGSHELTGAEAVGLEAFLFRFPEDHSGPDPRYNPDTNWKGVTLQSLGELLMVSRRPHRGRLCANGPGR
ncbi:MAG TPA: HAD family hydrolase [Thermoplasmata archaeon]|nr:HAD family hydrolase [Thermoplasmata archaeon]